MAEASPEPAPGMLAKPVDEALAELVTFLEDELAEDLTVTADELRMELLMELLNEAIMEELMVDDAVMVAFWEVGKMAELEALVVLLPPDLL